MRKININNPEELKSDMELIDKSALVAEINKRIIDAPINYIGHQRVWAYNDVKDLIDTLEVKEVNIASMADDYYDALMEEAAVWMDEGSIGHCRLAYYTGCKDVLNKLQKGE